MKTKTSNLTRVLVTFLVSFICIFGASSYCIAQKTTETKPTPDIYKLIIGGKHEYPYDFTQENQYGQLMCYKITDTDNKTAAFVNPMFKNGHYLFDDIIIPDEVILDGYSYKVTSIGVFGLNCQGAFKCYENDRAINNNKWLLELEEDEPIDLARTSSTFKCKPAMTYFIPNTVQFIENQKHDYAEDSKTIVCYATTPPQFGENYTYLGVALVPKGCLEKYQKAKGWEHALLAEVDDDFQQYVDEGRINEYFEKANAKAKILRAEKAEYDRAQRIQKQQEYQAQQEQREKEWQAQQKKEMDQLKKQYGAKYVDAMQNGQITIGMPKGLVEYGIQNRLFKRFTSMSLDSQTATREVYDLYRFNPSDILTYKVGWISFTNGKVSSIHWN